MFDYGYPSSNETAHGIPKRNKQAAIIEITALNRFRFEKCLLFLSVYRKIDRFLRSAGAAHPHLTQIV